MEALQQLQKQSPLMDNISGPPSSPSAPSATNNRQPSWMVGSYYSSKCIHWWGCSLDEEFDESLRFEANFVFVVDAIEDMTSVADDAYSTRLLNSRDLDSSQPERSNGLRNATARTLAQ